MGAKYSWYSNEKAAGLRSMIRGQIKCNCIRPAMGGHNIMEVVGEDHSFAAICTF